MSDAAQIFNQAYELVEQGELAEARRLLDDIRDENENNPDFWWLYAHAVEDEAEGRAALQRVQQLQSDYPGLDNVAEKAGITAPKPIQPLRPPPPPMPMRPPRDESVDEFSDDFDDMDDDDFDFDTAEAGTQAGGNRSWMFIALLAIVIVVAAVLLIPRLLGGSETADLTPTIIGQVVATSIPVTVEPTDAVIVDTTEMVEPTDEPIQVVDPTDEPTDEPTDMPTDEPTDEPIVEPTEADEATGMPDVIPTIAGDETGDLSNLAVDLAEFSVPEDGVSQGETVLGNTLLISTCAPAGPLATQSIRGIVETLKSQTIPDDIEAIAFQLTNCDTGSVSRVIGVARSEYDNFVSDAITAQEFQALLRPIG